MIARILAILLLLCLAAQPIPHTWKASLTIHSDGTYNFSLKYALKTNGLVSYVLHGNYSPNKLELNVSAGLSNETSVSRISSISFHERRNNDGAVASYNYTQKIAGNNTKRLYRQNTTITIQKHTYHLNGTIQVNTNVPSVILALNISLNALILSENLTNKNLTVKSSNTSILVYIKNLRITDDDLDKNYISNIFTDQLPLFLKAGYSKASIRSRLEGRNYEYSEQLIGEQVLLPIVNESYAVPVLRLPWTDMYQPVGSWKNVIVEEARWQTTMLENGEAVFSIEVKGRSAETIGSLLKIIEDYKEIIPVGETIDVHGDGIIFSINGSRLESFTLARGTNISNIRIYVEASPTNTPTQPARGNIPLIPVITVITGLTVAAVLTALAVKHARSH